MIKLGIEKGRSYLLFCWLLVFTTILHDPSGPLFLSRGYKYSESTTAVEGNAKKLADLAVINVSVRTMVAA